MEIRIEDGDGIEWAKGVRWVGGGGIRQKKWRLEDPVEGG